MDKLPNEWIAPCGTKFVDWNKFSMDELADYLDKKWGLHSSGEAYAIMRMVDFYKKHKDKQ